MIVLNMKVRKLDESDPQFPAWDSIKRANGSIVGFSEVYVMDTETEDGPLQCPFFLTETLLARYPRQEIFAMMLESFAKAVRETKAEKAA